jgi:hypothetical protein
MDFQVEGTEFASSKAVKEMMTHMEAMYAAAFRASIVFAVWDRTKVTRIPPNSKR